MELDAEIGASQPVKASRAELLRLLAERTELANKLRVHLPLNAFHADALSAEIAQLRQLLADRDAVLPPAAPPTPQAAAAAMIAADFAAAGPGGADAAVHGIAMLAAGTTVSLKIGMLGKVCVGRPTVCITQQTRARACFRR